MRDSEIIPSEEVVVNTLPLDRKSAEIANEILSETDLAKVKDLTNLFNLSQRKKNVIRLMKFNGLLDKISDQMLERFEKKADEFSNADLLDYLQVVQSEIDRTQKSLDLISETPAIQVNTQNNVNINLDSGLGRDEKERVADAIRAILSRVNPEEIATYESEISKEEDNQEVAKLSDE